MMPFEACPSKNTANVVKTFRTNKYFAKNIWLLLFFLSYTVLATADASISYPFCHHYLKHFIGGRKGNKLF